MMPPTADCKGKGCVCGDPKIVGGDGVVFYFHGRKNQDFCRATSRGCKRWASCSAATP
jgi:hypothetical protein